MTVNEIKVLSFDYRNLLYKVKINGAEHNITFDRIVYEIANNIIGVINNTLEDTDHYTYSTIKGILDEVDYRYSHHVLK